MAALMAVMVAEVEEENKMDNGYILSDEILGHKINDSKYDHKYSYKASESLNDLELFTKLLKLIKKLTFLRTFILF